jgi:flagellar biosynthesis protein FlhB
VEGGLRLPSTSGAKVYRWQPFQVFVLATVFGFYTWVNTKVEAGTKDVLLDTERVALQELFNMIRRFSVGYAVELHKRTVSYVVFVVCLHVLSEVLNTISKECNLALARTGVSSRSAILGKNLCLLC